MSSLSAARNSFPGAGLAKKELSTQCSASSHNFAGQPVTQTKQPLKIGELRMGQLMLPWTTFREFGVGVVDNRKQG